MAQNYFNQNPIRNWTIAEDCRRVFLETEEKQERWQKIKEREEAKLIPAHIETPKSIKPFVQFNN